jgi:hypothetical protein
MAKKVVKSSSAKAEPKIVPKAVLKDSTEIDDLFSALSSAKKAKTLPTATEVSPIEKDTVKKSGKTKKTTENLKDKEEAEVTLSDLEDLEDEGEGAGEEESCLLTDDEVIIGTAYDPKKDDSFPGTTGSAVSIGDSDFFDSRGLKRKTRALTEDGYPIYTPSELKIGMGGGTDLCPFDCNCCY